MLLTICVMMFAAVAFIQDEKFFSSAPKEAQAVLRHRDRDPYPDRYNTPVSGNSYVQDALEQMKLLATMSSEF